MSKSGRFRFLFDPQALGEELKTRTIRGGAILLGTEAIEFVLRIASIVVLARLLVPEHFGILAMVTAITAILERFKDLGLSVATVQRATVTHEQVSNLFWLNVAIGVLLMLIVGALAPAFAAFYDEPRLLPITIAIATGFFWSGLVVQHQALHRRQMRFGTLAVVQIGATTLSVILAVALALLDFGYWALVVREVSRTVIVAAGSWIALRWVPSLPSRRSGVRSFVAFGSHISAFNLVWFLSTSIDQILVGRLFGAVPLALYRQGVALVLQPIAQLSYPVNSVAEATLSRLQDQPAEYRRYYVRIVGALSALTMPLCAFLAVFADPIVSVVLGNQWHDAAPYFQLLAIAVMLRPAASTAGFVQVTCGKSKRYFAWGLLSATALIACVGAGTLWGPIGVAVGQIVYTYVFVLPLLAWGLRGTPIRFRDVVGAVARPLAASLAMAGLMLLGFEMLSDSHLLALAIGAVLAPPAYLIVWYLLPGGREELRSLFAATASLVTRRAPRAA
jgi:PST family polysaccharide transporter